MKRVLALFFVVGLSGCGSDSGSNSPTLQDPPLRPGSTDECAALWSEVDSYRQSEAAMSNDEQMGYCLRVQEQFFGITCERMVSGSGAQSEVEDLDVNRDFCRRP